MADSDDEDITANLVLSGVRTLDPTLQPYYMAQASAQDVVCYQCLFVAQCVETIMAQNQTDCRIGFIGCGQMGRALLDALLENGFPAERVQICTRIVQSMATYHEMGVTITTEANSVSKNADVLFLACPPAHLKTVASKVRDQTSKNKVLIISLVAGVNLHKLNQLFGVKQSLRTTVSIPVLMGMLEDQTQRNANQGPRGSPHNHVQAPDFLSAAAELYARTDNIRHVLKALTAVGQTVGMTADNAQRIASQCMFGAGDSEEGKEGKEDDNEDAYQLVPSEIWSSHINNTIIKTFQTHFLEEMTNTNLG